MNSTRLVQQKTISILNKNRICPKNQDEIKAMGMAACQGLCIEYQIHSKAFCH